MSTPPEKTPEAAADTAAPKKSKKTLILITAALVVLLGGGGAAYWMYAGRSAAAAEGEKAAEHAEPEVKQGVVPMEAFVVNLADPGGSRFLRVTLSLVVDEEHAKELAHDEVTPMRVRSSILELLATQTADHLITPEGKAELKKSIAERAAHAAHNLKINDVLFTEFIVQ